MSKRNLLNEGTIRRFMKLAEIGTLASPFVSRMEEEMGEGYLEEEELEEEADWLDEDADFLEEEDYLGDDDTSYHMDSGVFEEDLDFLGEAEEGDVGAPDEDVEVGVELDEPVEDEAGEEEADEDEEGEAGEDEGDIKADAAEAMENLADELMATITDKLQDMVDAGELEISGAGEPEELDVATAAADDTDVELDVGEPGEGDELDMPAGLGAEGGDEGGDEELVAEIARRVAKRILTSRRK